MTEDLVEKPCDCKGIRTCLLCEKILSRKPKRNVLEECQVGEISYQYPSTCIYILEFLLESGILHVLRSLQQNLQRMECFQFL